MDREKDLDEAPDRLLSALYDTSKWSKGRLTFSAFGFTDNGDIAGSLSDGQGIDHETFELTSSGNVGTTDGKGFFPWENTTGEVTGDGHRQVYEGSVRGSDVVWGETESTSLLSSNWRIFSKQEDSPKPILVAQSEDVIDTPEMPMVSGDATPEIHQDRVFWNSAYASEEGQLLGSAVFSKKLNGIGTITREIVDATEPVSLQDSVAVMRLIKSKPGEDELLEEPDFPAARDQRGIDLLKNTGEVTALLRIDENAPSGNTLGELSGGGSTLITSFNGDTLIIDATNRTAVSIAEPAGKDLTAPQQCGNTATWTYIDGNGEGIGAQYFFNTQSKSLTSVPEKDLYGETICTENRIALSYLENDKTSAYWRVFSLKNPLD